MLEFLTSPRLYWLWKIRIKIGGHYLGALLESWMFRLVRRFVSVREFRFAVGADGFDISKWQGVVNFAKMFAYGAKFLILRAVYGITTDERFLEYFPSAVDYFPLSIYAYYDPRFTPTEQAHKLLAVIEPYKNKIHRVYLDLEFTWSGNYEAPANWKTYRDIVKAAGYRFGWYTRKTWWDLYVGNYADEFAKDPCWVAQYSNALTLIPKGWTRAMIWQSGTPAIGPQVGVSSAEIDHDVWNNEFDFMLEWGVDVIPPPTNGVDMELRVNATNGLRGRGTPGGSIKITFLYNDILTATETTVYDGANWYKITKCMRGTSQITIPDGFVWSSEGKPTDAGYPFVVDVTPPPTVETRQVTVTISETGWQTVTTTITQPKA